MKRLVICALAVAFILGGTAYAQGKVWDDLSWWGKSGATPAPVKDPVRSGFWWWPTTPKSNVDDKELWGNRGVVYHMYKEVAKKEEVKPPAPTPPAKVEKRTPAYSNVLFDFNKAVLKPEGKEVADKVIADLKAHPKDTLAIEGHASDEGTDEYNMALGQRRADAVKKYMVEQGIAADRITTKSYGKSKPAVPNDSPENRKLNRRVVFNQSVVD